ncbi:MAG: universal stress protein [Thermodesulfobacteriota bacterium]
MLPKIEKILYASSLSPKAPYIFRYAISQAQHYQAQIHFLHVLEPMSSFGKNIVDQYLTEEQKQKLEQDSLQWLQDKIKKRIQNFCAKETCDLDSQDPVAEILVAQGKPAETILETAQNLGADLIVIGAHRKTRFVPGFLGSTTRRVIDNSQIPVLCINTPKDFHDDLEHPIY